MRCSFGRDEIVLKVELGPSGDYKIIEVGFVGDDESI